LIGLASTGSFAGLASLDIGRDIAESLSLTQDASAFVPSDSSTFTSDTGVQARIAGDFKVRLSDTAGMIRPLLQERSTPTRSAALR
jgi:putative salt-induced outer membrane protein